MNDPGEILLFQTEDGSSRLEVRLVNETVWLSAGPIAELFQRDKSTISRPIQNVYDEGELKSEGTVALFATVQKEGGREVTRHIEHYSLDVIISVGYRVKSHRGVQFRIWATQQLRDCLVKGFATVQNKMHWASQGHTAAEVIHARADASKPHLGLTTWPTGQIRPRRADVAIAKNYLTAEEIDTLNRIVSLYLDFAELQTRDRKPIRAGRVLLMRMIV
jgi:hypothetical protein